jgi:restriction endonuclease TaqI-like protein
LEPPSDFNYARDIFFMKGHEAKLRSRSDQGMFWWELRSCAYYNVFESPKIVWQDLSYHSRFALCDPGIVVEATSFALPSSDLWLLSVLNSPLICSWLWRKAIHGKDEVLRLKNLYTERIPVITPSEEVRGKASQSASRLIVISSELHSVSVNFLDWLKVEFAIEKPSQRLQGAVSLNSDDLVGEVKKLRGKKQPLTSSSLKALRDEFERSIVPAQRLTSEATALERQVSDLVNAAYGLTSAEVDLMWQTAPPRMPLPKP